VTDLNLQTPTLPKRFDSWPIERLTTDTKQELLVVVADTAIRRFQGLMGLNDFSLEYGVLFRATRSVHTAFMRFSIDLLWLSEDSKVVRVDRNVEPFRVKSCRNADSVVELKSNSPMTELFLK